MRKSRAIRLLKVQIEKINDPLIKRSEWISTTSAVLLRIFPLSAEIKINHLKELEVISEFYNDMPTEKRIETRKKKAATYLNNYIEEIELFGEETNNKIEMFFGSFRFWGILLSICLISFIGGNSVASGQDLEIRKTSGQEVYSLNQVLLDQKKEIDSLNKLIREIKEQFDS